MQGSPQQLIALALALVACKGSEGSEDTHRRPRERGITHASVAPARDEVAYLEGPWATVRPDAVLLRRGDAISRVDFTGCLAGQEENVYGVVALGHGRALVYGGKTDRHGTSIHGSTTRYDELACVVEFSSKTLRALPEEAAKSSYYTAKVGEHSGWLYSDDTYKPIVVDPASGRVAPFAGGEVFVELDAIVRVIRRGDTDDAVVTDFDRTTFPPVKLRERTLKLGVRAGDLVGSRDGRWFGYEGETGQFSVVEVATGKVATAVRDHRGHARIRDIVGGDVLLETSRDGRYTLRWFRDGAAHGREASLALSPIIAWLPGERRVVTVDDSQLRYIDLPPP